MEEAFDIESKCIISAENATQASFRYLCPCCGKHVFVKGGYNIQRASFSHYPREGSPECENYHLSTSFGTVSRIFRARTPNLYLVVSVPDTPIPQWQLELLIPANISGTGAIIINQAIRGVVTIPCSILRNKGHRVPVRLQREPYQLDVSIDNTISDYHQKINSTPGLEINSVTIFHYSLQGGQRLLKDENLVWGNGYYIVWHQDFKMDWPGKLWKRILRRNGEWDCAEIELPVKFDDEVEFWAIELLNKKVKPQLISLCLISPIGFIEQTDGSLLINKDVEVLLGIAGDNETPVPGVLYIDPPDADVNCINLSCELPAVVSLGQLSKGQTRVWLSKIPEAHLIIVAEEFKPDFRQPEVCFIMHNRETDLREQIPAHSQLAGKALQNAWTKQSDLVDIVIPKRIPFNVTVNYIKKSIFHTRTIDLFSSQDYSGCFKDYQEYQEYICQTVTTLLRNPSNSLLINFENYGRPYIKDKKNQINNYPIVLPNEIRGRMQWLINLPINTKLVNRYSPINEIQCLIKYLNINSHINLVEEDQWLIKRFIQKPFWPINAEPYLRYSVKQIIRFLSTQKSKTL